ncbi:MAG TPA: carbon-nitrogen hydrolase family protein [Candidatus Sulfotelmatobacter sp.]|nr:carbon-nitrogen hydrolase family protein [Candidatus Sulfotelmatobacter sp.]
MTKSRKPGPSGSKGLAAQRSFRVAIAQFAPVYLDKAASVAKAIRLVREAKKRGAELVAFGETWLPGYPAWLDVSPKIALWDHAPTKQVFARLRENSVTVPGPEIEALQKAAGDLGINVVIGVNERVDEGPGNGTLYNSILTITSEGKLANHHRKLVPTYTERMVWGNGDGRGLTSIESGPRIGGLICWEHWMPLARMALHNAGEHVHVALWPTAHELHQLCSRHYAFEGRCFVLAVGLTMQRSDIPEEFPSEGRAADEGREWVERGGSAIIAPDSRYVVEPVYDREEFIVADLDLSEIDQAVMTLDVSGHYSRPDVFTFETKVR